MSKSKTTLTFNSLAELSALLTPTDELPCPASDADASCVVEPSEFVARVSADPCADVADDDTLLAFASLLNQSLQDWARTTSAGRQYG